MKNAVDVSFAHDYDSDLYMLSKDRDAKTWKVIVHCEDGKQHVSSIEKFFAYPGCETHEGEAAWCVDYFDPLKIEIQRPGLKPVIIKHPDKP
jgi:hypothetical protein